MTITRGSRATVFRLTARCPKCGAHPRLRNTERAVELLRFGLLHLKIEPGDVLQTYQCSWKDEDGVVCNEMYDIIADDWQESVA